MSVLKSHAKNLEYVGIEVVVSKNEGKLVRMNGKLKGNFQLLLVAFIWGAAYVAQSSGMDYVGPYTYNMVRNVVSFFFLIPVIFIIEYRKDTPGGDAVTNLENQALKETLCTEGNSRTESSKNTISLTFWNVIRPNHITLIAGICSGIAFSVATTFQQVGITMTTAGKSGFITALYIIFVPILSTVLGKKVPKLIWPIVGLAMIGFYLLCVKEDFSISEGDVLTLVGAIFFSIQIIIIDYFTSEKVDGVKMAFVQFGTATVVLTPLMFAMESPSIDAIFSAWLTIGYAGILSGGVASTLQIVAQKDTEPTIATLIMSLESVFAVLLGWILLHETLSLKELVGCIIVLIAVILVQMPWLSQNTQAGTDNIEED